MKEEWLVGVETTELGVFRNHFDFHPPFSNNKSMNGGKSTSNKKKPPIFNGHIEPGSPPPKEIEEILAPKLPSVKATPSTTQSEIYVPSTKTLMQEAEMKKSMIGMILFLFTLHMPRLFCRA